MSDSKSCVCKGGSTLIFACSGAADVGAVADQAARELTRQGVGKMFCLAGIGGRVSGIMETTKSASKILAVDGCALDCVKKTLEEGGFESFEHVRLTDTGMKKGETAVNDESIAKAVEECKGRLN